MMSKKSWWRISLLVAGSTVAALQLGACIAEALLANLVLAATN